MQQSVHHTNEDDLEDDEIINQNYFIRMHSSIHLYVSVYYDYQPYFFFNQTVSNNKVTVC